MYHPSFQRLTVSSRYLLQAAESAGHTAQALEKVNQEKLTLQKEKLAAEALVQEFKNAKEDTQSQVSGGLKPRTWCCHWSECIFAGVYGKLTLCLLL